MAVPPDGRPAWLGLLPDFLFRTDPRPARYLLRALPLTIVPALVLAAIAAVLLEPTVPPDVPQGTVGAVVLVVLVAPLFETLLMTPVVLLLARFVGPGAAVAGNALLWGVLHSAAAPIWGLVIWWPFLIFSIALLTWRERGLVTAIAMVAAMHALHNSVPALLLLLHPLLS